jgi:HK97 gp10 family phage protein
MMAYDSNIRQVIKYLTENEERALEAVGLFVRGEVQVRAPVDTGNLRDSYDYEVDPAVKVVRIGTNVDYAIYQEYGTRKMKAQPHLTPAIEENKNKIKQLIADQLGRGLND